MKTTRTATESIAVEANCRIAIVADTHSKLHRDAERWLERLEPTAILHAGDIGRHQVLDDLAAIAPTFAVRGNIDEHAARTPDHLVIDLESGGKAVLRMFMTHIGVYGPRIRKDATIAATKHAASLVICGHSHVPLVNQERGVTVFNPGSIGPRRFSLPITFGVLEIADGKLGLHHIDCETGEQWLPPTL